MALLPDLLRPFRRSAPPAPALRAEPEIAKAYTVPTAGGGWYPLIREAFTGAWQRNHVEVNHALAASFHADFACKTLIARDIAKLPVRLMARTADGIWEETTNPAFSPVLRKPNHFQTRNQLWETWILSKLSRGNTYALKRRDNRGVVTELYVLNPDRVWPLVADDGSVFYRLGMEALAELSGDVTVPASEIIHDRMNPLFHWLVGVPPIYASGLAATQGLNIQTQSVRLFSNNSQPGGILTAPGRITDDTAKRLKEDWEANFTGRNFGRVAVLGDGLKYETMSPTAKDAQLIEQLKWSAEVVCSAYHVPPYKIGVGAMPTNNNVQALNVEYYTQCLQSLIEDAESCLDDGLGLGDRADLGVEFDVDNLLRMDTVSQMDALEKGRNYLTPNEGRRKLNLPKKAGGDSVYRQQQDFSLEALAKRDAREDPFAKPTDAAAVPKPNADPAEESANDEKRGDSDQRIRQRFKASHARNRIAA
jgi:HK97 family phage portal protein